MTPTDKQRAKFEAAATHDMLWAAISEMNRLGRSISCDEMRAVLTAALAAQEDGGGERVAVSEDKLLFIAMNAYDNTMARGLNEVAAMRMAVRNVLRATQEGTSNG